MKNIFFYLIFFISFISFAQPANDDCANAINLSLQTLDNIIYTDGNLGNATESTPACSGSVSTDVWYSFTANSVGNTVYLPSQYNLDLAFEIYDACGGNSIACVDENSANVSEYYYNNNFIVGHTYYVKVFLYNQSLTDAPFQIAVIDIPSPANDECSNAINLALQDLSSIAYTNADLGGATQSTSACTGGISTDVWFTFTPNSVANRIFLPAQSGLDLAFEILDACGGNSIACVDNNGVNYSEAYYDVNFIPGQTYFIKVFLVNQKLAYAPFEIAVVDIPSPANDDCANATSLNVMTDASQMTTAQLGGATESLPACAGSDADDVWFSFVANNTEQTIKIGATSGLDSVFELFDACNGTSLACVDDNSINYSEILTYQNFTPGQTYYVRVYGYDAKYFDMDFNIVVYGAGDSVPPTANALPDYTLYLDNSGNASLSPADIDNGSTDNIGIVSYSLSQTNFDCSDVGNNNIYVTLTVTDAAGNSDSADTHITVVDDINPTPVVQNIQIDLAGNTSVSIDATDVDYGSYDNCGIASMTLSQDTFTATGNYTVDFTVTDDSLNSLSATVNVEVVDSVDGIGDLKFSQDLQVYPNPVTDMLSVISKRQSIKKIEIANLNGQLVINQDFNSQKEVRLNLSTLQAGLYLLKITDVEDNIAYLKLLKH